MDLRSWLVVLTLVVASALNGCGAAKDTQTSSGPCCVSNSNHAIQIGSQRYSCGYPPSELSYTLSRDPKFVCTCSKQQNCSAALESEQPFSFVSSISKQKLAIERINDDICDIGDDEPATSACSQALFYCSAGIPRVFPSSRVDDGIVDCCDCSDEPRMRSSCDLRQCATEREHMEREERERAEILFGGLSKLREISLSSLSRFNSMKDEVSTIQKAIESASNEKAAMDALVKSEEEVERAERDNRRKQALEQLRETLSQMITSPDQLARISAEVALSQGEYGVMTLKSAVETDPIAAKSLGDDYESKIKECVAPPPSDGSAVSQQDKVTSLVTALGLVQASQSLLWDVILAKMQHQHRQVVKFAKEVFRSEFPSDVDAQISALLNEVEAHHVRAQTEEARRKAAELVGKLDDLRGRLANIEKFLGYDLGPNATMIHILDQEFSRKHGEYTWKFKPFERCQQDSTDLGKFTSWGPVKDTDVIPQEINEGKNIPKPTIIMKFEQGLRCYQGTVRSTTVYMRCGWKDELLAIFEPDVCRYVYLFSTPVACLEKDILIQANESFFASVWRKAKKLVTWS